MLSEPLDLSLDVMFLPALLRERGSAVGPVLGLCVFHVVVVVGVFFFFFFFNDPATTEIYTLSLHDALPICFRNSSCNI